MFIIPGNTTEEVLLDNIKNAVENIEKNGVKYNDYTIYPTSGKIIIIGDEKLKDKIININYQDDPEGNIYIRMPSNGILISIKKKSLPHQRKFDDLNNENCAFNWSIEDSGNFWEAIFNKPSLETPDRYQAEADKRIANENIMKNNKSYGDYMEKNQENNVLFLSTIVIDMKMIFKEEFYNRFIDDYLTTSDLCLNIQFTSGNIILKYPCFSDIGANKHFRINHSKEINKYLYVHNYNLDKRPLRENGTIVPVYSKLGDHFELRYDTCSICNKLIYNKIAYNEMFNATSHVIYQPVCLNCINSTALDYIKYIDFDVTKEEAINVCKYNGYSLDKISYIDHLIELENTKFRILNKNLKFNMNEKERRKLREGDVYKLSVWIFDNMEVDEPEYLKHKNTFEFESVDILVDDVTVPYSMPDGKKKKYYVTSLSYLLNNIGNKDYIKTINDNYENILIGNMARPEEWCCVP